MPWFYYVARVVIRSFLMLVTRCQVRGKENIPAEGPLLVVVNHISMVDPPLLGVSLGRKMIFMAKKELFQPRLKGYFIGGFGAFPVHRGEIDRPAMQRAYRVLADGFALVMFPEGTRSHNAQLQRALPGAALVAVRSGAPILPVGVYGTEGMKGFRWLWRRPRITVNVGQTFHLPSANGRLRKPELAELANDIMERIAELLPVEYRGEYGAKGE